MSAEFNPSAAESWMEDAACATTDPDIFFPDVRQSAAPARKVCAGCPVIDSCADFAERTSQEYGIFGGLTPSERRKARSAA